MCEKEVLKERWNLVEVCRCDFLLAWEIASLSSTFNLSISDTFFAIYWVNAHRKQLKWCYCITATHSSVPYYHSCSLDYLCSYLCMTRGYETDLMTLPPPLWTCGDMISINNSDKCCAELARPGAKTGPKRSRVNVSSAASSRSSGASFTSKSLRLPLSFCRSDAHCWVCPEKNPTLVCLRSWGIVWSRLG